MLQITSELRRRAREMVDAGALPTVEPRAIFGGHGDGRNCSLCGCVVESSEVEFEFDLGGATYRFHQSCHAAWQARVQPFDP